MVEENRRRLQSIPDSPDISLSSDLDWALQSFQASKSKILEILVHEYYAFLYRLAYSLLDDSTMAEEVVQEVLVTVLTQRDRFRWEIGIKTQFCKLIYRECRKRSRSLSVQHIFERFFDRSDAAQNSTVMKLPSNEDVTIWRYLDALPKYERQLLVLYYVHDLYVLEIAEVFSSKEGVIDRHLEVARNTLLESLESKKTVKGFSEAHLAQSLQRRWLLTNFTGAELDVVIKTVLQRLTEKTKRGRLLALSQQVVVGGLVIGLIAVIGWITSLSTKMTESRSQVVKTVIITQLVHIPKPTDKPPPTHSLIPTRQPLMVTSSVKEVYQRMMESYNLWDTMWVDGLIVQYGPPGYIGPPRVRRDQVWINQPHYSLVLTGPEHGEVDHAWFSVSGRVYDVDLATGRPRLYDFHGDRLPVYSPLESLIFPSENEISELDLEIIGIERVADRDTMVVDWIDHDNSILYRLWIDVYTGVVLRLRQFAKNSETITFEVVITSIEINKDFPDNTFNRKKLSLEFVKAGIHEDIPLSKRSTPLSPTIEPLLERTPLPKIAPPPGFNPSQYELKFYWTQPSPAARLQPFLKRDRLPDTFGQNMPVDVYAGDYYLGQVELNPWSVTCDRSADGHLLAFVTQSGEDGDAVPKLSMVNLNDIFTVHLTPPEVLPDWDIAFAPNGQHLAFQGCVKQKCGIFMMDTNSNDIERVYLDEGRNFTWSPDSNYLAWLGALPLSEAPGVFAANIQTGEIAIYEEFNLESDDFSTQLIFEKRGFDFTDFTFGLEACSIP